MNEHMIREIYERHADNVYRLCYSYLKNTEDAKDALQNTFVRLMKTEKEFESVEHEKGWLIVTAGNVCKDMLKSFWRKKVTIDDESFSNIPVHDENRELRLAVLSLPVKYRISLYLHYYEGYTSAEIAKLMKKSDGTVRGYLAKGRDLLKERLGEV